MGITEAGGYRSGTVKSSVGLGSLLLEGIGDTIRISLASDPVDEVKVGWDILKSLKIRTRGINFIACPSCSRMNFDVIGTMNQLESRLEDIKEETVAFNFEKEFKKKIDIEKNKKFNQFSMIYFNKVKSNILIK